MNRLRNIVPFVLATFVLALSFMPLMPMVSAQDSFSTAAQAELKRAITSAGRFGAPRYTTVLLPTCNAANNGGIAYDTTTTSFKYCNGSSWVAPGGGGASAITMNDDIPLAFGTAADSTRPAILFNTTETPDTGMFLTGTVSNHWIIAENQDKTFDFGHAATTDPTLFVHSHNQSTSEFFAVHNDGTYTTFWSGSGPGRYRFSGTSDASALLDVSSGVTTRSGMAIGWSSSSTDASAAAQDTSLRRKAAATVQLGVDANGAVIAQQLQGANGITGTDIAGGNFTVGGQVGTGAGAGSQTSINRALILGTGTTAQGSANGLTVCESKSLSTTTATTTALATVALASNTAGAVRITVGVQCSDGTNFDSDVVTSYVGYVNKAGVLTIGTPVTTASAAANNSGSCTVAPTFTAGSSLVNVNVTPAFSTIVPTSVTAFMNVENLGSGAVSCK